METGGVLAEPLPGAPSAQVGGVYGAVTYILEAPKATFAFEIVGEGPSPAAVSAAIGARHLEPPFPAQRREQVSSPR